LEDSNTEPPAALLKNFKKKKKKQKEEKKKKKIIYWTPIRDSEREWSRITTYVSKICPSTQPFQQVLTPCT